MMYCSRMSTWMRERERSGKAGGEERVKALAGGIHTKFHAWSFP
jgi:hypothetical protein